MNILIINQALDNRGNESAHKALVRELSKQYPNDSTTYYPMLLWIIKWWKRLSSRHLMYGMFVIPTIHYSEKDS